MDILQAILLGLIQGLTEFLPVSSSGHIELGEALLDANLNAEESVTFTILLHAATALSTIVVFRKDILDIIKGLFKLPLSDEFWFSVKIILSMIPAAFVGLFFDEFIQELFDGKVLLVGMMLIITGLLLFLADKARNTNREVGFIDAILIGVAQAIAILPGISRSGATISTSVLLGIDRTRAARFSFLMVVPLILGKMAKDGLDEGISVQAEMITPYTAGFIAAFVSGFLACKWMIALVQKSQLKYFSFYCFAVGAVVIILMLF